MTKLISMGWNSFFESQVPEHQRQHLTLGRVTAEHRTEYEVATEVGQIRAKSRGRLHFQAHASADLPVVGDWVCLSVYEREGMIERRLDRKTLFSRKSPGSASEEQVICANVDVAFIVSSLGVELNRARMERYLAAVIESGAEPVFVLTKVDLCHDSEAALAEIKAFAPLVKVVAVNSLEGLGLAPLRDILSNGRTGVLIGPSGVGKSTLVNALANAPVLETGSVREGDHKGRHTTTHRELIALEGGGNLIDTPGMREFQIWDSGSGIESVFSDIETLMTSCKFSDCRHENEPGCAVRQALEDGSLDEGRLANFRKLERENAYMLRRHDKAKQREEKEKWKKIHQSVRSGRR